MMNKSYLKSILLFVYTLILVSPIFEYIHLSIPIRCFIMLISTFVIEINSKTFINSRIIICVLLILILSSIVAFHYMNESYIFFLFNTLVFLIVLAFYDKKMIMDFIDIASIFLFILEIGALLGFIYVFIGGKSIFSFPNPDGRENYFFPFTLSNVYRGKLIRPSGIYDEPGAFSFFIVSIALLRIYYKKGSSQTFILLLLGLITFSLAHIISFIILLFPILRDMDKKQRKITLIFLLFFLLILFFLFYDILNSLIFLRLTINKTTGRFNGDTRTAQIPNTLRLIKDNGLFWGNFLMTRDYVINNYGVISENPLSQLARFGIFISFPYYSFLFICIIAFFVTKKFLYLAIIGLFVQRPYSHLFGYATFFIIFYEMALDDIYTEIRLMKYLKR